MDVRAYYTSQFSRLQNTTTMIANEFVQLNDWLGCDEVSLMVSKSKYGNFNHEQVGEICNHLRRRSYMRLKSYLSVDSTPWRCVERNILLSLSRDVRNIIPSKALFSIKIIQSNGIVYQLSPSPNKVIDFQKFNAQKAIQPLPINMPDGIQYLLIKM